LAAGIEALTAMMESDAEAASGVSWGRTRGKIGFHDGKVELERPRVRPDSIAQNCGYRVGRAIEEDWLGKGAMNLMLSTYRRGSSGRNVSFPVFQQRTSP